jgi:2'-5' RNA ligase
MPRLFVAVDLPAAVRVALARIQPHPSPGIRLVEPGQMHLTLHYIGDVDQERAARMAEALTAVSAPRFSLAFEKIGQLPSAAGATTLVAAVRESRELRELHAAVAGALAAEGFRPEARPYTPHVSLARCEPQVPAGVVSEFLARHRGVTLPEVAVTSFGLYSSVLVADVPLYRRERAFPLQAAVDGDGEPA